MPHAVRLRGCLLHLRYVYSKRVVISCRNVPDQPSRRSINAFRQSKPGAAPYSISYAVTTLMRMITAHIDTGHR